MGGITAFELDIGGLKMNQMRSTLLDFCFLFLQFVFETGIPDVIEIKSYSWIFEHFFEKEQYMPLYNSYTRNTCATDVYQL